MFSSITILNILKICFGGLNEKENDIEMDLIKLKDPLLDEQYLRRTILEEPLLNDNDILDNDKNDNDIL